MHHIISSFEEGEFDSMSMTQYVVFNARKKREDETLHQFYQAITLGVVEAPTLAKAERAAWTQYGYAVSVVAVKKAPLLQQGFIQALLQKAEATR